MLLRNGAISGNGLVLLRGLATGPDSPFQPINFTFLRRKFSGVSCDVSNGKTLPFPRGAGLGGACPLSCATVPPAPSPAPGGFAGGSSGSDLVARSTGFRFPARVGVFVRDDSQQYDETGQDLSVTYQAGVLIVATIYEYPTGGKVLDTEFADRKDEIKSVHKDARLLRDEEVTIHPGRKARRGRKAVFVLQEGFAYHSEQPYQSDLLVFERGKSLCRLWVFLPGCASRKSGNRDCEIHRRPSLAGN